MNKTIKATIFLVAAVLNALFFYLCGYWQQIQFHTPTYQKIDWVCGILAVIILAMGEMYTLVQIYYRKKYTGMTKKVFGIRFWRQCILLVLFYVASLALMSNLLFTFIIYYIAVFAIVLSFGWMKGSAIIWTDESGSSGYYMTEKGVFYTVREIMENTQVWELACSRPGDRERIITIYKKGTDRLDEKNQNYMAP